MNAHDAISMLVMGVIGLAIYFLPTIIASQRNHNYTLVIFAINLFLGITGIAYLIILIWSLWPAKTPLFGVLINDPVSNSLEDGKHIYNQIEQQTATVSDKLSNTAELLQQYGGLLNSGFITQEEFDTKKAELLAR